MGYRGSVLYFLTICLSVCACVCVNVQVNESCYISMEELLIVYNDSPDDCSLYLPSLCTMYCPSGSSYLANVHFRHVRELQPTFPGISDILHYLDTVDMRESAARSSSTMQVGALVDMITNRTTRCLYL